MLLSSDLWVGALIRRAEQGGAFAAVARKGDARAGAVLVKAIDRRAGTARLYAEAFAGEEGEQFARLRAGETTFDIHGFPHPEH